MNLTAHMQALLATALKNISPQAPKANAPRAEVSLDDVPPELIHEILLLVPQPFILNFGLTSRKNYELCQRALHYRIVLTHENLSSLHFPKIARDDPALRWVKELKLGYQSDSGWDVLSDGSILTAFPNLRLLDALGHAPMRGWAGLLHVIDSLPSTMTHLSGNMYCTGDSHVWPTERTFPSYKSLLLTLKTEHYGLEDIVGHCAIPATLSASFPCLVNLTMDLRFRLRDTSGFWNGCHFPALRSFTLIRLPMAHEDGRALASLLSRHATTLREISFTEVSLPAEAALLFVHVACKPDHVCACIHMAIILGQSPSLCSTLRTLHIISCFHGMTGIESVRVLPPCVLDVVHTLHVDMDAITEGALQLDDVSRLVPNIRAVTVHFRLTDSHKAAQALSHFKTQQTFLWNCTALEKIVLLPVEEESSTFVLVRPPKGGLVKLRKIQRN